MQIESSSDRYNHKSEADTSTFSQVNLFPIDKGSFENFISVARSSHPQEGSRANRALSSHFDTTSAFEICDGSQNAQSGSARNYKDLADAVVQLSDTTRVQSSNDKRNADSSKGPIDESKMAIGVVKPDDNYKGSAKDAGAKQQDGNDWIGKSKDVSAAEVKESKQLEGLRSEAKKIAENIKKSGLDYPTADYFTLQKMWDQAKDLPGDPNKTMTDTMRAAFEKAGIADVKVSVVDSSSKDAPKTPWNKHCDSIMLLERNSGPVRGLFTALGSRANEWARDPKATIARPSK